MGSERFDVYMERCLYGPDGFYSSGRGSAGRRRDFITSPEVGPLFSAVLARAIDSWWYELGRPSQFPVVDMGGGRGTLLRGLEAAAPECSEVWELRNLDRVGSDEVDIGSLTNGVIIANELLDNLSFRIAERTPEGMREVWVEDGSEQLRNTDITLDIEIGTRAPMHEAARSWFDWALGSGAARILVFDYGMSSTSELAKRGGWLRTYQSHRRGSDPYLEPGRWDITADVGFDQFRPPTQFSTQAEFLKQWGIDSLVSEGKEYWRRHASAPDLKALAMRSRVTEAEALLDTNGLGAWLVGLWGPEGP